MSAGASEREPLRWSGLTRSDGISIEQARARNNSWYMIVPEADGSFDLRYASQSANSHIMSTGTTEDAKRAAETHADRYDTRA